MRSSLMAFLAMGLTAVAVAAATRAAPLDLHEHWDQRCSGCHGHAADFARRWLTVEQGRLEGHHHRDNLAQFLRNHYLADDLVEPVMQMLAAQAAQAPTFKERCAGCHQSAAEFTRGSLELRAGVLYGRKSGKPVRDYLATHGGLSSAEIAPMVETLNRVRREVAPAS
jgi:hypothetical protein